MKEQQWQNWSVILLGAWLLLSPLIGIGDIRDVAAINSYAIGALVAIFSFAALTRPKIWEEYTTFILGLWLTVAPFALDFASQIGPTLNQFIVGLLIVSLSLGASIHTPKIGHGPKGHGHA